MDDVIVVSTPEVKNQILKEISKEKQLVKATFRSFQDLIKDLVGEYRLDARIQLARSENISPELAEIKLKNSLIVSGKYQNRKIHDLLRIRNKYQSFLNLNPLSERLYHNRPLILVSCYEASDLFQKALSLIKEKTNLINYRFESNLKKQVILEFPDPKAEIEYLIQEVGKLLLEGVNPENIKIQNVPNTYFPYLREAFFLSDIALDIKKRTNLFEYEIVQEFLEGLSLYLESDLESGFSNALSPLGREAENILFALNEVLNKYLTLTYRVKDIYDDLVYQLKKTAIKPESYKNVISVADYQNEYQSSEDKIFILGFNQDLFPKTYKDDDYLLDFEREKLGLPTSRIRNREERLKGLLLINHSENPQISYALNHQGLRIPISSLISLMPGIEIKPGKRDEITYSLELDRLRLGKALDLYHRYRVITPDLYNLHATWPSIPYKTYLHDFTGVDHESLNKLLKRKLSYTAIDQYYRCGFLYYLERVLNIKREGNTSALFTGNLFHKCLELLVQGNFDNPEEFIKEAITKYLEENQKVPTAKEKFFLKKYLEIILLFYQYLETEKENSDLENFALEKSFNFELKDGFTFEGKIDKIQVLKFAGKDYAVVVDYKSGSADIDLNRIIYGLNMQIPLYFYLLKKAGYSFSFGGGYLQKVLPNNVFGRDPKLTYEEQFFKYFRKVGYSAKNNYILEAIDHNLGNQNSTLEGIRLTKDGYHAFSQRYLLTEDMFRELLLIIEEKIEEARSKISQGEFPINPKLSDKFDSCTYCQYRDLCFRDERDYQRLFEYKNLEFLKVKS